MSMHDVVYGITPGAVKDFQALLAQTVRCAEKGLLPDQLREIRDGMASQNHLAGQLEKTIRDAAEDGSLGKLTPEAISSLVLYLVRRVEREF